MNQPKFRLEPVLELKDKQEDKVQQELAEVQRVHRQAEEELSRLTELRREQMQEVRMQQSSGGSLETIRQGFLYIDTLAAQIELQGQQVAELASLVDAKRLKLVSIMQEKKTLETLKEKHVRRIGEIERKADEKISEEAALTRYRRKS